MDDIVKGKLGEIKKEVQDDKEQRQKRGTNKRKSLKEETNKLQVREKYMKVDNNIKMDAKMEKNAKQYAENKVDNINDKKKQERPKRNKK